MPFVSPDVVRILGFVTLFLLVAPLFPFIYVVLRWRTEGRDEPGLGTHAALLYFRNAGILLALAGAANLTYGWLSTTPIDEAMTRISWGMLCGSVLFLAVNVGLLRLHGHGSAPARRVFLGFFMIMAGLVAFTAIVLLFVTLFQKAPTTDSAALRADQLKLYGSWTAYYLGAYLVAVLRLRPPPPG